MQPYFTANGARDGHRNSGPTAEPQGVPISFSLTGQQGPIEVHVDVSRFIDVGAERKRLEKERENLTKQIDVDRRQAQQQRLRRQSAAGGRPAAAR